MSRILGEGMGGCNIRFMIKNIYYSNIIKPEANVASSAFPKRIFQKTYWLGAAVVVFVIALASFPQPVSGAADCPANPIKGSISLFMKGSYLDVQFGKNPELHKNTILKDTINKTILKPLKLEGFP